MQVIHNTFHYLDMMGDITFLSSEILSLRLCESAECVRDLRSIFSLNGFTRWDKEQISMLFLGQSEFSVN